MTEDQDEKGGALEGAFDTIGDAIGDVVTGIPKPIRRNALKAMARLCTAAVEYPAALIENAVAERKAESQARIKLVDVSASQIAEQMRTDPEYIRAASRKFAQRVVRERVNVDNIAAIARDELKSAPSQANKQAAEPPPISDDWLNAFESEAAQLSSEQMQLLFGKILAGEIRRPTTYSIRTIKLMAQLDNQAANLFKRLCSLSISLWFQGTRILDARVVSFGNAGQNTLQPFGLSFDQLSLLEEYGLIISDYNSYMDYGPCIAIGGRVGLPFTHENKKWGLRHKDGALAKTSLKVHGVRLSKAGTEILPIVDIQRDEKYTEKLMSFFDGQGLIMTPAVAES